MISPVAYRLDLPWPSGSILSFDVLNLKRFHQSGELERKERPPSPMVVDGEEEYEVEVIIKDKGKGARHLYLVI